MPSANLPADLESLRTPIDRVSIDPANPNQHPQRQIDQLAASFLEFGQDQPIVADMDGVIAKGAGRYLAARQLGWTDVAVVFVDDDTVKRIRRNIADNQTAKLAEMDTQALLLLVQAQDEPVPGFDEEALKELLAEAAKGQPIPDHDAVVDGTAEELRQKWGVNPGDLWGLGRHRLLCADCTDEAQVRRLLGNDRPVLMVTDPPYGVMYDPNWRNEAAEEGFLDYAPRRVGVVHNDDRVDWSDAYALFPGDVAYTWSPGGDLVIQTGMALQASGFEIRNQIIWVKPHFPISRGHYTYQHEPCWYGVRKGSQAHWIGDHSASTTWHIALDQNVEGGHSTQKPLLCMATPIANHDAPIVYDPFLGSGTTLIACENLKRQFLGCEIDPGYVAVALERWSKVTGQTPALIEAQADYVPQAPEAPEPALEAGDILFASDNDYGIPTLRLDLQAEALTAPIGVWGGYGTNRRSSLAGGTWLFYTSDERFESLWRDPAPVVRSGAASAAEINFSCYDEMPSALVLQQIYRKRWIARWWQENGVRVFVDLNVSARYYEQNLMGVPKGWRAYCTRGYSARLDLTQHEYELACDWAGTDDILFFVYGGGEQVRLYCQERSWLWHPKMRTLLRERRKEREASNG